MMLGGCTKIWNVVIPPHPNSYQGFPDKVCVTLEDAPRESLFAGAAASVIIEAASKFAVKQVSKAIDKESKNYSSTYSGRDASELIQVKKETRKETKKDGSIIESSVFKAGLAVNGISVKRIIGSAAKQGCQADDLSKDDIAIEFRALIELSTQADALEIIPTYFEMHKAKAKVRAPRWYYPWSWWMYFDEKKVDVNIQILLSVIAESKKSGRTEIVIANRDFPMGKIDLTEGKKISEEDDLISLRSGWNPIPKLSFPDNITNEITLVGPLNLTVTIMESDDFGDVLAKGSAKLTEHEDDIVEAILKRLSISND
jgi:hypothetical protein